MLFESASQIWILLFMLWAGAVLALIFNALFIFRRIKVLGHIVDFAFLLLCGVVYLQAVIFCDYGEISFATMLFMILGFVLMHKTGGRFVKGPLELLYKLLVKWYNNCKTKILKRYIKSLKKKRARQKVRDERFAVRYLLRHKRRQA